MSPAGYAMPSSAWQTPPIPMPPVTQAIGYGINGQMHFSYQPDINTASQQQSTFQGLAKSGDELDPQVVSHIHYLGYREAQLREWDQRLWCFEKSLLARESAFRKKEGKP